MINALPYRNMQDSDTGIVDATFNVSIYRVSQ